MCAESNDVIKIVLCANKIDLVDESAAEGAEVREEEDKRGEVSVPQREIHSRKITRREGEEKARSIGENVSFLEVSALRSIGIDEILPIIGK